MAAKPRAYTFGLSIQFESTRKRQDPAPAAASFWQALAEGRRHPARLLVLWNWKSALLSLLLRGPIFLVASVHRGWRTAMAALLTESIFCVLSAGFYGALVEALRHAQPLWLTGVFLTVLIPAFSWALEYLLHWFRGTPHLRPAEIASLVISALSALFNWYAMRRGALLVGKGSAAFRADLRRLPNLVAGFLVVLPRQLAARSRAGSAAFENRVASDDSSHGR
jgi:hypothetical protein